jgi:predicted helicase
MGWPIARDSFDDVDDLFYEFSAEELGIDPKTSAKILEIKRLRPLSPKQPWGIFFVKFEPKKLPVIALRRILGQVALKRRASANSPDRTAWSADDLLFISNYGDGDARQISFAHFSKSESSLDLPTLRVLGWNNLDTGLHLDAVAKELTENLTWPEEGGDLNQWRKTWSDAFKLGHNEVINTAKDLSIRLAELASSIRDRIKVALSIENDSGPLTLLKNAFKSSLVNDLDNDSFADMYAQTIAYGLLSARITDPSKKTVDDFTSHMRTSPFLRELMETFLKIGGRKGKAGGSGIDFDELGVGDVIQLLDNVNIEAVLRDFGDKNRQEDPVMHFFEGFLQAYDKKIRKDRGVFYTPQPVVSYIVRSVHELLQTEFGLTDGLADIVTWGEMLKKHPEMKLPSLTDELGEKRTISPTEPFVQILDPATGTATFLIEVIEVIHQTLTAKWKQQRLNETQQLAAWNDYVPKHLLPRLHAFELMMAPYAIAHMKVGLKLAETGYRFATDERARIYLTNALEPYQKQLNLPELDALAHEAAAVNDIKRNKRFTVVIGNPPYSGVSSNNSEYAKRLADAYKIIDGKRLDEKKLWLQDDYVKFLRIAQKFVDHAGIGVLGFITNHGYLDNPTFRGMRQSLLSSFNWRQVVDLHGNAKKKEIAPDGSSDNNVFDIQQGVAIGLFAKLFNTKTSKNIINRSDLFGDRENKYLALSAASLYSLPSDVLYPSTPFYLFVQQDQTYRKEYEEMLLLSEITHLHSVGIVTARDNLTIAFTSDEIWERVQRFSKLTEEAARDEFHLRADVRDWKISFAQSDLNSKPLSRDLVKPILYRPFDTRFTYFTGKNKGFIGQPAAAVMSHMMSIENIGLMTTRKVEVGTFGHALCSRAITESHSVSLKEVNYLFPLWLRPDEQGINFSIRKRPNFTPEFLRLLCASLGVKQEGEHGLPANVTPEDIFNYTYAIFYSPIYRTRYFEFLKIDFPRLPLPRNLQLFRKLSKLGSDLVSFHLLESLSLEHSNNNFIGSQSVAIEKISWSQKTVWIDKDKSTGFNGVSEEVWNFQIGGYQVCEKWLKDRKGRTLAGEDIIHYQRVIVALYETIRLMKEVDAVIEQYGSWPTAFQSSHTKGV